MGKETEENKASSTSSWDEIGIHRSLASFWYQFVLIIIAAVPVLLMTSFILPNYILPFPEALGFRSLTVGYFALFFSIMDFATGPAAERYIAEYAETNPEKALHYIQFFIWFQAITGLIQITMINFFCFNYIVKTNLQYAMWFFIIYSTIQYPGMLGAYKSTLNGFQRFDKRNLVDLVQSVGFELVTQIIFVLLGRMWGRNNPEMGELMGATIGFIIGVYIDDFFALWLSAVYVKQVITLYGLELKKTIIPEFTFEEAKESLVFGGKLLGAMIISTFTDYITLMMMITWVDNYVAIIGYIEIARGIAGIVTFRMNFSAMISQSYNNNKKKLTQYVISESFHHWFYLTMFLLTLIAVIAPSVVGILGGTYAQAAWIIPWYILPRLIVVPAVMGADILIACDLPEYRSVGIVAEKITKMLMIFLFLSPFGFFRNPGLEVTIIIYALHDIPPYIVITAVEFYYIQKHAVKVKIRWWKTFGAGTLATLPILILTLLVRAIINYYSSIGDMTGVLITLGLALLIGFMLGPAIVLFFYGILGGWDRHSLHDFEKTVSISGPSKPFVKLFYRSTKKGYDLCPIKKRENPLFEEADMEIQELMQIKNSISI